MSILLEIMMSDEVFVLQLQRDDDDDENGWFAMARVYDSRVSPTRFYEIMRSSFVAPLCFASHIFV